MKALIIVLIVALFWIWLDSQSKSNQYYDEEWEGVKYNLDTIILFCLAIFMVLLVIMFFLEKAPNV